MQPCTTDSELDVKIATLLYGDFIYYRSTAALCFGGALICYIMTSVDRFDGYLRSGNVQHAVVKNVLTGSCKFHRLSPQLPDDLPSFYHLTNIFQVLPGGYRILLVYVDNQHSDSKRLLLYLYSSITDLWSDDTLTLSQNDCSNVEAVGPLVDDSLYLLFCVKVFEDDVEEDDMEGAGDEYFTDLVFRSYNMGTKQWSGFTVHPVAPIHQQFMTNREENRVFSLLSCGSKTMMVSVVEREEYDDGVSVILHNLTIRVFEVDMDLQEFSPVSQTLASRTRFSQLDAPHVREFTRFCSDETHLYVGIYPRWTLVVHCYDLLQQAWTRLTSPSQASGHGPTTWSNSKFLPGLNPFFDPSSVGTAQAMQM
ncbi:hypothetical protein Mapa_001093 [Marchantia paleacea]|nr:hypothetical protein Mapa_001093 [Marchantia paleacea]